MEVLRKKSCALVVPGDPSHPPCDLLVLSPVGNRHLGFHKLNAFVLSTFVYKVAWVKLVFDNRLFTPLT